MSTTISVENLLRLKFTSGEHSDGSPGRPLTEDRALRGMSVYRPVQSRVLGATSRAITQLP